MSDIVERLRNRELPFLIYVEAADEIERLRAENVRLKDLANTISSSDLARQKRVKALEAALVPFACVAENDIAEDESDRDIFRPMRSGHNRAALLKVGDLRRAAAILAETGAKETSEP